MIQTSRLGNYGAREDYGGGSSYQAQPSIFQNDDENSMHNMYGFKSNEVSIHDVFKFTDASQKQNLTETRKYHYFDKAHRDLDGSNAKWEAMGFNQEKLHHLEAEFNQQRRQS